MITGAHTIIYTKDADKLRAFFRDVLGFRSVDAGHGWLIFESPPAELAVHPAEDEAGPQNEHELFLMCDDLGKTVAELKKKGVELARPISETRYGLMTAIKLPGGGELGIYEPRHPTAI
jgi:catechol 2,3-dioxygenase-like lactoylglutathione lyase family enzyme